MPHWVVPTIFAVLAVIAVGGGYLVYRYLPDIERAEHRDKQAAQRREWDKWSRSGPQYRASLQFREMEPWLRNANNLPPVHDESQYHD